MIIPMINISFDDDMPNDKDSKIIISWNHWYVDMHTDALSPTMASDLLGLVLFKIFLDSQSLFFILNR